MTYLLVLAIALFGACVAVMRSRAACYWARFGCWLRWDFWSASSRRVGGAAKRLHYSIGIGGRIIHKWRKSVAGEDWLCREYSLLLVLARKLLSDLAAVARGAHIGKCCAACRHPRRSCSGG